jgi:hypothetical protein
LKAGRNFTFASQLVFQHSTNSLQDPVLDELFPGDGEFLYTMAVVSENGRLFNFDGWQAAIPGFVALTLEITVRITVPDHGWGAERPSKSRAGSVFCRIGRWNKAETGISTTLSSFGHQAG